MRIWKQARLHTMLKKGKTARRFRILLMVSTLILTAFPSGPPPIRRIALKRDRNYAKRATERKDGKQT